MYQKKYHIHFVGIGGIGMSGIAELLINLGYRVSGSDLKATDITRHLAELGGTVYEGHAGEYVNGADVVVTSSAVRSGNPEVEAARNASIPVIPRAEMLAELMRLKYSIAVAGAHGKTSTTSMVASILAEGGLDPTVVIGGKLKSIGANAVLGRGDYIVAEADESDGSFLKFTPTIAVITNIDREHLDFYQGIDEIKRVFLDFIHRAPFYGLAILCLDNEHIQDLIPGIRKRFMTYGLNSQADFQARDIQFDGPRSRFQVYRQGVALGEIPLNLPGIHNVNNALAAIAVGLELDIPFERIRAALKRFEGVQRRMEIKGERNGVMVMDDYGHHPTEIRSTLEAVRESWPGRRRVVVFQPHRYTRTQALLDDFARAFYQTDLLIVLPVYSAGEVEIPGVDGESLLRKIQAHGHKQAYYARNFEEAVRFVNELTTAGDIVLTLGAGDVLKVGEAWLRA